MTLAGKSGQQLKLGASEEKIGREPRAYPRVLPKYQNPDRPSETWAGRGKQPRWVTAQLKSGKVQGLVDPTFV
ncbi:H-NS histone family protein [Bradyrhizobium sp. 149]|nr:H-NS histone family protein [Bradyrhizobium sp. 149]